MILFACNDMDDQLDQLTPEQLAGGPCDDGQFPALQQCTGQTIIAAWAVGGQVLPRALYDTHYEIFSCMFMFTCLHMFTSKA